MILWIDQNGQRGSKMFNLNKIIKSWFNGDGKKVASREQLLEEERKSQGLSASETPEVFEAVVNSKSKDEYEPTVEGKLGKRDDEVASISEARMDKELTYSKRVNDDVRDEVPRVNVASEKWDNEYREAFAKAQKSLDKQEDIFEKYMGKKGGKKVPNNVPESASGLPNRPERFKNFDGVPGIDVKENIKNIGSHSDVSSMHTIGSLDSIKKLDAAAFYLAYKVASEQRDFSKEESSIIEKIIDKKRELLSSL